MTMRVSTGSATATDLLFGPAANAAEALAGQIMSAESDLDRALRGLPEATRKAAVSEAAATAAGLLDVPLDGLLLTGWRLHHDLASAARHTLASPGSTELVDLVRHQVTVDQEPSVAVLVNRQQVATIQLGLTVEFDISALVAGIKAGLLVAIHAGSCDVTATLSIQGTEVHSESTHLDLRVALAVSPGLRLLPAEDYPAAARPAAALFGADVVVVVLDHVHGRLLRGRGAAVDADVGGHQVLFLVGMGALVLGDQPAGPRVRAVVQQQAVHVLVPRVLVVALAGFVVLVVFVVLVLEVVGLLLGQELVQGLAFLLLGCHAVPDPGRPSLRRRDAAVQRVIPGICDQRVVRVLHVVVFQVGRLMAPLVGHVPAPFRPFDPTNLSRPRKARRSGPGPDVACWPGLALPSERGGHGRAGRPGRGAYRPGFAGQPG